MNHKRIPGAYRELQTGRRAVRAQGGIRVVSAATTNGPRLFRKPSTSASASFWLPDLSITSGMQAPNLGAGQCARHLPIGIAGMCGKPIKPNPITCGCRMVRNRPTRDDLLALAT